MSDSIIKNKSFSFAIRIVKLYKFLLENKKEYVLSKQLLRSGLLSYDSGILNGQVATENNLLQGQYRDNSGSLGGLGEARESIAINYKGKDISIAFNPGYLMDPLKVVETDEVFLELSDELSPGSVKVNTPFHYVLMPMRMT